MLRCRHYPTTIARTGTTGDCTQVATVGGANDGRSAVENQAGGRAVDKQAAPGVGHFAFGEADPATVRGVIASCVAAMPLHEQFIDRYCRSPVAA